MGKLATVGVCALAISLVALSIIAFASTQGPFGDDARADPAPKAGAAAGNNTVWATARDPTTGWRVLKNGQPYTIKGVCYAPSEINFDPNWGYCPSDTSQPCSFTFGDLFWDEYEDPPGFAHQDWRPLWSNATYNAEYPGRDDLQTIRTTLGGNALRTYWAQSRVQLKDQQTGRLVYPIDPLPRLTHQRFLDTALANGVDVMVNIPIPAACFVLPTSQGQNASDPTFCDWWMDVAVETATEFGAHPATMGFIIFNEVAGQPDTSPPEGSTERSDFFYFNVLNFATAIRAAAPGKLVGWSQNFDLTIPYFLARNKPLQGNALLQANVTIGEQLSGVLSFMGVNAYTDDVGLRNALGPFFSQDDIKQSSYGLPEYTPWMPPVLFTEMGIPASTRDPPSPDIVITDDSAAATAKLMAAHLPIALQEYANVSVGVFWFEFADELFKADDSSALPPGTYGRGEPWFQDPSQDCTLPPTVFPGGCWDEEAFGLFGRYRGADREPSSPDTWSSSTMVGPVLPFDTLEPRPAMVAALQAAYTAPATTVPAAA